MEIDHVIMAVSDPEATAARLREEHGLGAIPGGVHPGGTGNWLVPLRDAQYLELIYVAAPDLMAAEPANLAFLAMDLSEEPLLGWALRTSAIEAVGARLGRAPEPGAVAANDRSPASSWRTVSDPETGGGAQPFFIQYDDHDGHRAAWWADNYAAAAHAVEVGGFAWVEVAASEAALREWIGDHDQRLRCVAGSAGLRRAAISTTHGEVIVPRTCQPRRRRSLLGPP